MADLNEQPSKSLLTPARALSGAWLALYGAWYWVAPWLAERRGDSDEAAWVPMFLLPSLVIGGLFGLALVIKPNRPVLVLFGIATLVHAAIGLGLHPR